MTETINGWRVVATLLKTDARGRQYYVVECEECGAREEYLRPAISRQRCKHPVIDGRTPYADDVVCQIAVSAGPLRLDDIADLMGVHRERVRQIEAQALRKLRAVIERQPELRDALLEMLARKDEPTQWDAIDRYALDRHEDTHGPRKEAKWA